MYGLFKWDKQISSLFQHKNNVYNSNSPPPPPKKKKKKNNNNNNNIQEDLFYLVDL